MILEIACFNTESALIAQRAGADRIELCEDYKAGGVTPALQDFIKVKAKVSVPIFVMIRPRGGNFAYNDQELKKMKEEITEYKKSGADGFVFGILDKYQCVDKTRCSELVELAYPLQTTFHRAFDEVKDPLHELENIISCGFTRILTSGQKPAALEGAGLISELIQKASNRIVILPGGGIRSGNATALAVKTGAREFHSAAINKNTLLVDEKEVRDLKLVLQR